jgi:hypothetical protein
MAELTQKKLNIIAALILLIGCSVGGVVYWTGTRAEVGNSADQSSSMEIPENSKAAQRDEEMFGGKALLLTRDLRNAWEKWQHPKPIGMTIAGASVVAALFAFWIGSLRAE